jgi:hypothetical protein
MNVPISFFHQWRDLLPSSSAQFVMVDEEGDVCDNEDCCGGDCSR